MPTTGIELKISGFNKDAHDDIVINSQYYLVDENDDRFQVKSFDLAGNDLLNAGQKKAIKDVLLLIENKIKEIEGVV